jgi:hypothetical protein
MEDLQRPRVDDWWDAEPVLKRGQHKVKHDNGGIRLALLSSRIYFGISFLWVSQEVDGKGTKK